MTSRVPIDVPTEATVAFIESQVSRPASILEVGCGAGHVARALLDRGHDVVGIDRDDEAVARAQGRGVPATRASWPEFETSSVDAIVFTRSLHHIHSLDEAIDRARDVLRPNGRLIVEDFAVDEVEPEAVDWFFDVVRAPAARALIEPKPDELVTELLAADDPSAVWQSDHDHDLHSARAIERSIRRRFEMQDARTTAYFYRYLVPVLPETQAASMLVARVLAEEEELGAQGRLAVIGRRFVATRPSA